MAYEDGIISIKTVGGVTYGISVYDVQRALGRGTPDVGLLCSDQEWYLDHIDPLTDEPVYLLRRVGKINRWAKYKPVRYNKLGILTDAERKSVYFGFDITPTKGGAADLSSFLTRYATEWTYHPPRGKGNGASGADEWFRLLDFDGYNRNANCFINEYDSIFPPYTIVGQSIRFRFGLNSGANLNTNSIGVADLQLNLLGDITIDFNDLYGGLLFVQGTTYKLITSPYKLGEDNQQYVYTHGTEITVPAFDSTGSYTVYPVLSRNAYSVLTTPTNTDDIISLPVLENFGPRAFEVRSEQTQQNLSVLIEPAPVAYVGERGRLYVQFSLGMTGNPNTMNAVYQIFAASYDGDTSGEQLGLSGTINLSAGTPGSVTIPGLNVTIPSYVRIHAYNSGIPAVQTNPDVWVEVSVGPSFE